MYIKNMRTSIFIPKKHQDYINNETLATRNKHQQLTKPVQELATNTDQGKQYQTIQKLSGKIIQKEYFKMAEKTKVGMRKKK